MIHPGVDQTSMIHPGADPTSMIHPGAGPGFLERGFICVKVCVCGGGGFTLLNLFFIYLILYVPSTIFQL